MEIIKVQHAGFCFGVSNAVKKAHETAKIYKGIKKVYSLGKIIHNDHVVSDLESEGIITVNSPEEVENDSVVIIRAHGVSPEVINKLADKNCTVVDATCPFVEKIHRKVFEYYRNGYKIIICGDRNHPEVLGTNGMCENTALVISDEEGAENLKNLISRSENVCLVAQTTFNQKIFKKISENIKKNLDNVIIFDTICSATSMRQQETEEVSGQVDLMIVVGGRESSNTRKLYEISKEHCGNVISVESASEIGRLQNVNISKVGVTAGASTPDDVIEEVIVTMSMENSIENSVAENEESFESMLEGSLRTLTTGETVKGTVTKIDAKGVYIGLDFKYEGFIAIDEFKSVGGQDEPKVEIGEEVEAVVVKVSDKDCEVVLSKRRVDYKKELQALEDSFNNKTPIEVTITEVVKGGVIARLGSSRIFIPGSQLDDRFVRNLESYIGKTLEVIIISYEKGQKGRVRIVASRKVIIDEAKKVSSEAFWSDAYVGKVCKGTVKSFTPFGAFIDLGGIDGLVHISELSWRKIKRPQDVLSIGQEVEVTILALDQEKSKISLGYRKPEDNPWYDAENLYQVGDILEVKVVRFASFGVFVNIAKGIDGLVHISQISSKRLESAEQVLQKGQIVSAKIIDVDIPNQKISLSIKEVKPYDPEPTPEEIAAAEEAAEKKAKKLAKKQKAAEKAEEEFKIENAPSGTSIADILASKKQE